MILLKLKWQHINIIYYNNKSHNVYDEDIENKRKMLSLIIKKVWYIPLKKTITTVKEKKIEIAKMSSYSKLSFWRPTRQQSNQVGRQQHLGLSPWDQKKFSSCLDLYL